TTSPEVVRSRAIPEYSCPKSQKYLKVCFCTNVSKSSSGIRSNLSVSSIPVLSIQTLPLESSAPEVDFTPGLTINLYDDKILNPSLGVTDTFFSCKHS